MAQINTAPRKKKYDDEFYDYEAAKKAGITKPDATGHWPSEFKKEGHPNLIVGGYNTKTGERVPGTKQGTEKELRASGWDAESSKRLGRKEEMPIDTGPKKQKAVDYVTLRTDESRRATNARNREEIVRRTRPGASMNKTGDENLGIDTAPSNRKKKR